MATHITHAGRAGRRTEMAHPYDPTPQRCQCCGLGKPTVPYGEADSTGHVWTYYTCEQCQAHCTSDEEGRPLHLEPTHAD